MHCAGSLAMEAGYPDKSSEFADEGTLAHAVAAYCLEHEHDAAFLVDEKTPFVYDDHGVTKSAHITADMAREVQKFLDEIRSIADADSVLMVEQRLPFFRDDPDLPEQFGTSDVVIIQPAAKRLHVRDLKYGRGVQVFAEENEQLMLYALGALDEFDLLYDIEEVVLAIHQPRLNHMDEWTCTIEQLREFEQRAKAAARTALGIAGGLMSSKREEVQIRLAPGEDQCRFCKARGDCPALRDRVFAAVVGDFENLDAPPPVELRNGEVLVTIAEAEKIIAVAHGVGAKAVDFDAASGEYFIVNKPVASPNLETHAPNVSTAPVTMLAAMLDEVPLIENWCKAVRAEAERRMLAGGTMPGYKLVQGKAGPRSWQDEAEAESTFKAMRLKKEVMYDYRLISPTTAEKLAAAGKIGAKQWAKLQGLVVRSQGGLSVAPAADPRPAVTITPVADDFESLPDNDLI